MRNSSLIAALAALVTRVAGQDCISLSGSTECSAFQSASIQPTSAYLRGLYPWLAYVSNVRTFDQQLSQYVSQTYVEAKYVDLFGCDISNLSNTTSYYARYTTSFVCNVIIQNSLTPCNLTNTTAPPLCADSCASFATSESEIVTNSELCPGRNNNYLDQLRADFTNCALPDNSITGTCVPGATNEPDNCGFSNNLAGLCNFCRASTGNATDSCCYTSNSTTRCQGVTLPTLIPVPSLFSTTTSPGSSPTSTTNPTNNSNNNPSRRGGLSAGDIAGIVIGSVFGFLLLLGAIIFCCISYRKRRRGTSNSSILNQPSPQRKGGDVAAMTYNPPASSQGYEVLPGGRVARMSAMQSDETPQIGQRQYATDTYGGSPGSHEKIAGIMGAIKNSPGSHESSPGSNDFSSPEGVASGQSEQLPFFKDYYSNDDIHPNDKVSVLWAYQPRAGDEFELERGDMLKVVGIWDDGWATGIRIDDRAEDYEGKDKAQRDSGVSHGSTVREDSPINGEIKAFPLVCVCLPEAWRKTVEGDSSTESGSGLPRT